MQFDPRRVPDSEKQAKGNYDPIPRDLYKMEIVKSEIENDQQSGHTRLSIGWVVLEGEYQRRRVWDDIPQSGSEKRMAYGRGALARLCEAVGMSAGFGHESELEGMWAWVDVYVDNYNGKDRNKVGGYQTKPIEGYGQTHAPQHSPQTSRPPQQEQRAPQHRTVDAREGPQGGYADSDGRRGGGSQPQPTPPQDSGYYNDDDVPF